MEIPKLNICNFTATVLYELLDQPTLVRQSERSLLPDTKQWVKLVAGQYMSRSTVYETVHSMMYKVVPQR